MQLQSTTRRCHCARPVLQALTGILTLALSTFSMTAAKAETDWNSKAINWVDYSTALGLAGTEKKPILLILHSEGCGACREYSALFHHPEMVEASSSLIMVLVDDGTDEALSDKFSPDGSYVPRSFLLSCKGELLDIAIGKPESRFRYYYDSRKPERLIEKIKLAVKTGC